MTAKEYLKQYRRLSDDRESKKEQLDRLRELAKGVSRPERPGSSGRISDKVGRTVAKILDLENKLCGQISRQLELKAEIEGSIAKVDDPMLKRLLTFRYINGDEWEQISESMNYSVRQIHRLHGKALLKIKDVTQCH